MKKLLLLLFLISSHSHLYPLTLTKTDKAVVLTLAAGGGLTGGMVGALAGYKFGNYIGAHERPADTHAILAVGGYPLLSKITRKQNIKKTASYFVLSPALGYIGAKGGVRLGAKLAILYIARKYRVDYETARKAIVAKLE